MLLSCRKRRLRCRRLRRDEKFVALELIERNALPDNIGEEILALCQRVIHLGEHMNDKVYRRLDARLMHQPVFGPTRLQVFMRHTTSLRNLSLRPLASDIMMINYISGVSSNIQEPETTMTITADKIIRLATVLDRTGLSRSTVYRKISDGTFSKQIQISIHGAGWRESEINRWIANPPAYRADENVAG